MKIYIFGYGSLFNVDSLNKTIERKLTREELHTANLKGFTRVWNYKASIFSDLLNKNIEAAFLNLVSSKNDSVNGVYFEVTEFELERLKKREMYYDLVNISDKINTKNKLNMYTFICYNQQHLTNRESKVYVMQKYIDIVHKGCMEIDDNFKKEFDKTTQPFTHEIVSGDYHFM